MLNLGDYYVEIFGFLNPIFDWITDFINTYVFAGFQVLIAFLMDGGFLNG